MAQSTAQTSKNMRTGTYNEYIDWTRFEAECFSPCLFLNPFGGCGATALSLLSGVNPECFRPRDHWSDKFMTKFLIDRGFMVQEVTKCDVTRYSGGINSMINESHVLLASQLVSKNTASWSVMHNKLWYHNFDVCNFRPTILLNSPILTCYLVWHEKWMSDRSKFNI